MVPRPHEITSAHVRTGQAAPAAAALHRRGHASRLHLARELRISNSRVCDLVDKHGREGLLDEDMPASASDAGGAASASGSTRASATSLGFDMEAKRLRLV